MTCVCLFPGPPVSVPGRSVRPYDPSSPCPVFGEPHPCLRGFPSPDEGSRPHREGPRWSQGLRGESRRFKCLPRHPFTSSSCPSLLSLPLFVPPLRCRPVSSRHAPRGPFSPETGVRGGVGHSDTTPVLHVFERLKSLGWDGGGGRTPVRVVGPSSPSDPGDTRPQSHSPSPFPFLPGRTLRLPATIPLSTWE